MVPASNLNWCPLNGNFDKISKRLTTCGITFPFSVTNSQHQHMTILDMIQSLFHLRWHKMNTYSRLHICINGTSTLGLPVVTFPFVVSPPTLHMQSRSMVWPYYENMNSYLDYLSLFVQAPPHHTTQSQLWESIVMNREYTTMYQYQL